MGIRVWIAYLWNSFAALNDPFWHLWHFGNGMGRESKRGMEFSWCLYILW